jgi:GMP synthase (glutamine-hydrolysing)
VVNSRSDIRFLLLQLRKAVDPMRRQEVESFAHTLGCDVDQIAVADLLAGWPVASRLQTADVVLLGGSGEYSATSNEAWIVPILEGLAELAELGKPTFASCWGFQAFARALGGRCIHDPAHAELGNVDLQLSEAGRTDPLFGQLPSNFSGHAGHEDHVVELPPNAILLASTERVRNQAFCLRDKPIYCTQFHPELTCDRLFERVRAYPQYVERIAGIPLEQFERTCRETPEANSLLGRFVEMVTG